MSRNWNKEKHRLSCRVSTMPGAVLRGAFEDSNLTNYFKYRSDVRQNIWWLLGVLSEPVIAQVFAFQPARSWFVRSYLPIVIISQARIYISKSTVIVARSVVMNLQIGVCAVLSSKMN